MINLMNIIDLFLNLRIFCLYSAFNISISENKNLNFAEIKINK